MRLFEWKTHTLSHEVGALADLFGDRVRVAWTPGNRQLVASLQPDQLSPPDAVLLARALEEYAAARLRAGFTRAWQVQEYDKQIYPRIMTAIRAVLTSQDVVVSPTSDALHMRLRRATPDGEVFSAPPTVDQITDAVLGNEDYRRVLYTHPDGSLQLVAMTVWTLIPAEVHTDGHQYFLVKAGSGLLKVDGKATRLEHCAAQWVVRGQRHEVVADLGTPLRLFVTYTPAHHPRGRRDVYNVDLLQ